jgi:hypothetical protein
VTPELTVCDPAGSAEAVPAEPVPAEPVASMPPADAAVPAEVLAPDAGPVPPSVDDAGSSARIASPTRQRAEPGLGTMTSAQPVTSAAVTNSGAQPVWPASPAAPAVPMVPMAPGSPSTANSSHSTASGTGQHQESYVVLAILHAGPTVVFGQVGGGSTSSLAAHVIGGPDDPGSRPA